MLNRTAVALVDCGLAGMFAGPISLLKPLRFIYPGCAMWLRAIRTRVERGQPWS